MLAAFAQRMAVTTPRRGLALGWAALVWSVGIGVTINAGLPTHLWPAVPLIGALLILVDALAVRDRSTQPLSLAGLVLLITALHYGLPTATLLGLSSGLLIKTPRLWPGWTEVLARRIVESGGRALAVGTSVLLVAQQSPLVQAIGLIVGYFVGVQGVRLIFAWLWAGTEITNNRLTTLIPDLLLVEVLPLALAPLGAAIIHSFTWPYVALAVAGFMGSAVILRRSTRSLGQQRRAVLELAQINSISRAIIRAELDVDALCNLIYSEASKVVDTENFRLGLFSGKQFELKVRVEDGKRQPPLTVTLADNEGIVGWMRQTGRSLLVDDFAVELEHLPAKPTYHAEHPPRSGIYIPLLTGDTVIGTISIQSRQPHVFGSDDLRLMSLIADQAAIAIDKARAYFAARRRAAQLATISEVSRQVTAILDLDRLLPAVVKRIRASFGYYQVHLLTLDSDKQELVLRASTNPDSPFWHTQNGRLAVGIGLVGQVVQTGEPLLVNNVEEEPQYLPDLVDVGSEMVLPMHVGTQLIGVLDVQSDRRNAFDENDFFVMQTLADQIGIAIDSANIFTAQQEEAWVLNALLQSAENIARLSKLDELLDLLVRLPPMLVGCDRAICMLWDREAQRWTMEEAWGISAAQRDALLHRPVTEIEAPLLAKIRHQGEEQVINSDERNHVLWPALVPICDEGSVLAVPMMTRATTVGVLLLNQCDDTQSWSARQLTIASGIANQAAAAIEGALYAHAEGERQRLEQELNVAREIQTSLLPSRVPHLEGWDIAAMWRVARQVGGDFYDFWTFHSGPFSGGLGFVIADVSDKGVAAALFMALSRSLVRAAALDGSTPARAMERANRWIVRDSQSYMFVTLFYGVLNPTSGHLRYTCAGHNPPLLYRATSGEIEPLWTPGIALGVLDEVELNEADIQLEPGDVLVCYTDGVTEAVNDAIQEWGLAHLQTTIMNTADQCAQTMIEAILAGLAAHTGDRPAFDDVTLLVIKYAPEPSSSRM